MAQRRSTTLGFKQTASVLGTRIRKAGESRGFAVSRVLTHWDDIVGADLAAMARPVKVGYARNGFGATLTVLTTGALAPMVEMQKEQMRARVNATYGYNAISRIRVTQTAPTGFAERPGSFSPAAKSARAQTDPAVARAAHATTEGVANSDLRLALEKLGRHVLTKSKN